MAAAAAAGHPGPALWTADDDEALAGALAGALVRAKAIMAASSAAEGAVAVLEKRFLRSPGAAKCAFQAFQAARGFAPRAQELPLAQGGRAVVSAPDEHAHQRYMAMLGKLGDWRPAEVRRREAASARLGTALSPLCPFLVGWATAGGGWQELLEGMRLRSAADGLGPGLKGPAPSVWHLNSMVYAYSKAGEIARARRFIARMADACVAHVRVAQ